MDRRGSGPTLELINQREKFKKSIEAAEAYWREDYNAEVVVCGVCSDNMAKKNCPSHLRKQRGPNFGIFSHDAPGRK